MHLKNLGINKPFLYKLVGQLAQIMHTPYPDLKDRQEEIAQVILNEENNFINTLSSSNTLLESEIGKVKSALEIYPKIEGFTVVGADASRALGAAAFRLYDTYGIPLEITRDGLDKMCIKVDENFETAFQSELDKQKEPFKIIQQDEG